MMPQTKKRKAVLLYAALLASGACFSASAQLAADAVTPETTTSVTIKNNGKPVKGGKWMVSVANPHAAIAARDVLKSGGSAIDAAITAQFMLGLVEPQSSGLGGGAFLVYFDGKSEQLTTLDGRETAPVAATPRLFQNKEGEPLKFFSAVIGGLSVGTPGTPALLWDMHQRWGKKPWADLITPAIAKAEEGFKVSERLATLVARSAKSLAADSVAAGYFLPNGKPIAVDALLRNPDYAKTLAALNGPDGVKPFYEGSLAERIIQKVQSFKPNPGVIDHIDFINYRVRQRPPICAEYRQHQICGMGPPSSGGLTVGQIVSLLQPYDIGALGPKSADAWRLIGDASRLAFADRGRYMADSDFVPLPTKGLLKPDYLKARSELLDTKKALETVSPGQPQWDHASLLADDEAIELLSTTHFSIVDAEGNAVSMTSTIENGFGSRLMVGGFLLNNELTDFSFRSHKDGVPIANRVEPGKRPRSSMAPTIVMKDGKPMLVIGSPGGSRIIGYVAKTIIAHLDWGMDIQAAIDLPHLVNRFGTYDLEAGTAAEELKPALEAFGFKTKVGDLNSGLHGIVIKPSGLEGGADPRREGIVLAE